MQYVPNSQSIETSLEDIINQRYCKLIDKVFKETWSIKLGDDKGKGVCKAVGELDVPDASIDHGGGIVVPGVGGEINKSGHCSNDDPKGDSFNKSADSRD